VLIALPATALPDSAICLCARNPALQGEIRHMDIRSIARNAARSEHLRRVHLKGAGKKGKPAWCEADNETVKALFPDKKALCKALPNRTWIAIRSRAGLFGLRKKQRRWLACDLSRLKRMWTAGAPKAELCVALPKYDWDQIRRQARCRGFRRPKRVLIVTGCTVIDQIKARAQYLNLSMGDVDAMAGTKDYFHSAGWRRTMHPNVNAVGKAILALDGDLLATWR
jgi:hypothetical protein